MTSNPPQNVSASAAIAKLPLDIIHCLLDFTTIVDLLHFCSTCQALCQHTDTKNDSIWKRACAFYGLRDFTHFRGLSPYTIYTQLLHPYGPLLGLWANDYPYLGNILEFKLCGGSENEQGGIVGEFWFFPRPPESPNDPLPPSYVRTLKISFETCPDAPPSGATSGSPPYSSTTPPVRVFCDAGTGYNGGHRAELTLFSTTKLGHQIRFYRRHVEFLRFPSGSLRGDASPSAWLDDFSRRLPRVPAVPETVEPWIRGQLALVAIYPAARLPVICEYPYPDIPAGNYSNGGLPALSFRCFPADGGNSSGTPVSCPCAALRTPALPFPTVAALSPSRYFPLRQTIVPLSPALDPSSPEWSPEGLVGLWLGAFGAHGTECLYVSYNHHEGLEAVPGEVGHLVATKITGDTNVPRGETCWWLSVQRQEDLRTNPLTIERHWRAQLGFVPPILMSGQGTLAGRGFLDAFEGHVLAAVLAADEMQIFWTWMHETRIYRRYRGRADPAVDLTTTAPHN